MEGEFCPVCRPSGQLRGTNLKLGKPFRRVPGPATTAESAHLFRGGIRLEEEQTRRAVLVYFTRRKCVTSACVPLVAKPGTCPLFIDSNRLCLPLVSGRHPSTLVVRPASTCKQSCKSSMSKPPTPRISRLKLRLNAPICSDWYQGRLHREPPEK